MNSNSISSRSLGTNNEVSKYPIFTQGLVEEIERICARFLYLGFVDMGITNSIEDGIVCLHTADLPAANNILLKVDLEHTRWHINLDSASSATMRYARYMEHLYRSAGHDPCVHIEYMAHYGNKWIEQKKSDGFIVTCFSKMKEKYLKRSTLSGRQALPIYCLLLTTAKNNPGQLAKILSAYSDSEAFGKGMDERSSYLRVTPTANRDAHRKNNQSVYLRLLRSGNLTIVYNALWVQLEEDEKRYLEARLAEGLDAAGGFALLLNLTDTRFSDLNVRTPTGISRSKIEKIKQSTLPEGNGETRERLLTILSAGNWVDIPLHSIYRNAVDNLLGANPQWRQWLHKQFGQPVYTIKEWLAFLTFAIRLHHDTFEHFVDLCGFRFVGRSEHEKYHMLLVTAHRIVTSSLSAAMDLYSLNYSSIHHPKERLLVQINGKADLTILADRDLSPQDLENQVLAFLHEAAAAYNRLDQVEEADEASPLLIRFCSGHLAQAQSDLVSQYLQALVSMLDKLPHAEIYLKALVDAYGELQYTGHNPSISVHNVLMDNKYAIYHRDVNFIRAARRCAKRIDMIIEEHGEAMRDRIVEEVTSYLLLAYRYLKNPNLAEEMRTAEEPVTYKNINIQRIDELIDELMEQKSLSTLERRAQVHLRSMLHATRHRLMNLPETNEIFQQDFVITLWDEAVGGSNIIFLGLETLVPRIAASVDASVVMSSPFDSSRDSPASARIHLSYPPPYCAFSLHPSQYPVLAQRYLDHYGEFALKVTDDVISAIEQDARRFKSGFDQLILLTHGDSGQLVGISNDRIKHFHLESSEISQGYFSSILDHLACDYRSSSVDNSRAWIETAEEVENTLLRKTIWLVELSSGAFGTDDGMSISRLIEDKYRTKGLAPQDNVVYVGNPENALMKEKSRDGYPVRSSANTKTVHYWPAMGYPNSIANLPKTYLNLLSFAFRYPRKLNYLFSIIREIAESTTKDLKPLPSMPIITMDIVKTALQALAEERNDVAVEELYAHISEIIHSKSDAESNRSHAKPLTRAQRDSVNSYIRILQATNAIRRM